MPIDNEGIMVCFAVITAFYNGDSVRYAKDAIKSIQDQSVGFENIRVYIHIDGELDSEHQKFIDENLDFFYKIVQSKQNVGLAIGLNRLLPLISEDLIFRMDLDDISHMSRFFQQSKFMKDNPQVDLLGCACNEIDENGNVEFTRTYPLAHEQIVAAMTIFCPILHPTFCFRRSLVDAGMRYPDYYLTEDLGFLFDVYLAGGIFANVDAVLFDWRKTDDFFRRRSLRRATTELFMYMKIVRHLRPVSFLYLYPIVRLIFRLMPRVIVRSIYNSNVRVLLGGFKEGSEK